MEYGSTTILVGDVLEQLATLPDESVHCVVTSPPYWGLRNYGVEGQIGLEATPAEFVAAMVRVFDEVRRVLRSDGVCFVNLGDSYATGAGKVGASPGGGQQGERWAQRGVMTQPNRMPIDGLKPKDLCGIPWRVAQALQAPRYTGRIKSEADRIWLAAMIDGEGCIFIHKRKAGQSNGQGYHRKSDSFGSGLEVSNTCEAIVRRCMDIAGIGSICEQGPEQNHRRRQRLYRWNVRSNECRWILEEVYPYLVAKQHEARLAIGCPSSGADAANAHESLKSLHNGGDADIDFAAPKALYEPGWYLRSDIIFSKPNPMPESVADRPTKAHEYIFLLTKSARYYWDADAVAEPSVDPESFAGRSPRNQHAFETSDPDKGRTRLGFQKLDGQRYPTRNARTVWTIPTQPYPAAHFATFPEALPERCVKAGTSEKGCCPECGKPWVRVVERERDAATESAYRNGRRSKMDASRKDGGFNALRGQEWSRLNNRATTGWRPSCECEELRRYPEPCAPCVVLDPFAGSGTTLAVAARLGRDAIGIELNPEYAKLAERRIGKALAPSTYRDHDSEQDAPLFAGLT